MIRLKNVTKAFSDKLVLDNLSFDFELGKVYGIVGENGAGKTTLFRCITGLEKFEGVIESHFEVLKDVLGYLQTEPFYFSRITGEEYLTLFAQARGMKNVDFEAQNVFDLPLKQYAEYYSTGMKKKLALQAVLCQKNEVLILDEPFNGVDIHSNLMIIEIIRRLKEKGKTILISSHIFSTLTDLCDGMIHLDKGKIKATYAKSDFSMLEEEMKGFIIGEKLDSLFT